MWVLVLLLAGHRSRVMGHLEASISIDFVHNKYEKQLISAKKQYRNK
jgi:hypothetical protein